jgi:hypothetical protein
MKLFFICLMLACTAFGQNTNTVIIIPDAADANLGKVRFLEKRANGSNYLDLIGQTSITANKVITLPNLTGRVIVEEADNVTRVTHLEANSGVGNYVKARKFDLQDNLGGVGFWDIFANVQSGLGGSNLLIRDNSGASVVNFWRAASGVALDYADVFVDWLPDANDSQKLGDTLRRWSALHATDVNAIHGYIQNLDYSAGVSVENNIRPKVDLLSDLGTSLKRWGEAHVQDLVVYGTCTGCVGTGYVTLATTQTITGRKEFSDTNIYVDLTATSAGTDEKRWRFGSLFTGAFSLETINDAYSTGSTALQFTRTGITPDALVVYGNLSPNGTRDIGSTGTRWNLGYVNSLDAAPAGVAGTYVKTRKLDLADNGGAAGIWDMYSIVDGVGNSKMYVRDNVGSPAVEFRRLSSSASANGLYSYMDVVPATGGLSIGYSGARWGNVFVSDVSAANITPVTSSSYDIGTSGNTFRNAYLGGLTVSTIDSNPSVQDLYPKTHNTYILGTTARYWANIYASNLGDSTHPITNLYVTTCTGCAAANMVTTNTVQTITSDKTFANVVIPSGNTLNVAGMTSASGTTAISAIFRPTVDNTYDLGTTIGASRVGWRTLYAQNLGSGTFTINNAYLGDLQLSRITNNPTVHDLYPETTNTYILGTSARRWLEIYATTYYAGATAGVSSTLSCGVGQAVKSITVSGGIVTAVACGTP